MQMWEERIHKQAGLTLVEVPEGNTRNGPQSLIPPFFVLSSDMCLDEPVGMNSGQRNLCLDKGWADMDFVAVSAPHERNL